MTVTPPSETPANGSAPRRAPRWMWIVLVVSIAFNLLVIGMAAAAAFMHFRAGHDGPKSKMARFIHTLPSERQEKLQSVFDERRSRFRPFRRAMRQARRRARNAFIAEPFDRDVLVAAYADAAKARMALTKARQEWFENLAQLMTADERRKYVKTRRHRGHRWRRHRDGNR
ncbi:MAG: putative membrane protein [Hyphomicrobiaceae bacterium]|jgi:uncharacterized membrane protein